MTGPALGGPLIIHQNAHSQDGVFGDHRIATDGDSMARTAALHLYSSQDFLKNTEAPRDLELGKHIKLNRMAAARKQTTQVIMNFSPSWFSVNMGTDVVATLLYNMPYNGNWLYWLSVVVSCLNVVLFVLFLLLSIIRYSVYPKLWAAMIRHPSQSLFLGTFPIGLATITNSVVYLCSPAWGNGAVILARTLWWIDAVISLIVCCYLPFVIMYLHNAELKTMTAAWLLPIVSTIVAAASGGIVAEALATHDPQHALWILTASYILWGTGVPLSMSVLAIYFQRLTIHKLPPREVIVSVFLPLGPLGQGGFGIMQLGKVAMQVFPQTGTLPAGTTNSGEVLYVIGWMIGLIMWGFGLVWLFFAAASISRSRFPFNMGWWGFTFPLGVYSISTITLGKELPSTFFDVLGTFFAICVILLWMMVSIGTFRKAITGELFSSPCLNELERQQSETKETTGTNAVIESLD